MRTGAISVLNMMFPETKTTEPYSPSERANVNANPVVNAGTSDGSRTRQEGLQSRCPERSGCLLDFGLDRLQHRLDRANDERQADKRQHQHDGEPRKAP